MTWVHIQIGNDYDENYLIYVSHNCRNCSSYVYVFLYIFHCVFKLISFYGTRYVSDVSCGMDNLSMFRVLCIGSAIVLFIWG